MAEDKSDLELVLEDQKDAFLSLLEKVGKAVEGPIDLSAYVTGEELKVRRVSQTEYEVIRTIRYKAGELEATQVLTATRSTINPADLISTQDGRVLNLFQNVVVEGISVESSANPDDNDYSMKSKIVLKSKDGTTSYSLDTRLCQLKSPLLDNSLSNRRYNFHIGGEGYQNRVESLTLNYLSLLKGANPVFTLSTHGQPIPESLGDITALERRLLGRDVRNLHLGFDFFERMMESGGNAGKVYPNPPNGQLLWESREQFESYTLMKAAVERFYRKHYLAQPQPAAPTL